MKTQTIDFRNPHHDLQFQISVKDYEFPEVTTGHDANWLITRIQVQHRHQDFSAEFPALLTGDLRFIVDWFKAVSAKQIPRFTTLCFTEPNLEFELYANTGDAIRFGIKLSHEFKPPLRIPELTLDEAFNEDDDFVMVFEYPFEDMRSFACRFQSLYDAWPQRGALWPREGGRSAGGVGPTLETPLRPGRHAKAIQASFAERCPMSIELRQAGPEDDGAVGDLVHRLLCELAPEREADFDRDDFQERADRLLRMPDRVWAFLALKDGEGPVGVILLNEGASIYAGGIFGTITELYIAPAYRSQGIAPRLIEAAVGLARQRGWGRLEVGAPDVPRWQRSLDFYLKEGFVEVGPRLKRLIPAD